jgi:hypothetical protein
MDPKQFFFTKPIFLGDEFEFGVLMLASAHDSLLISYIIIFMMHSHLMVTSSIDLSSVFFFQGRYGVGTNFGGVK